MTMQKGGFGSELKKFWLAAFILSVTVVPTVVRAQETTAPATETEQSTPPAKPADIALV